MTGPQAAKRLGITYRQLDHWYHRGWLGTDSHNTGPGSGYVRQITLEEFARASILATLVKAGIRADVAATYLDDAAVDDNGAVTVTTDGLLITVTKAAA